MTRSWLTLLLLGLAASSSAQPVPARMPVVRVLTRLAPDRSAQGDWPKYCGNVAMTGEASGESSITKVSVGALSLLWSAQLLGSVASSPTVVAGTVYIGDWGGTEWAFDAETGRVKASANLGSTAAPQCVPPALGITSAPAVSGGVLFVAGGDDAFYALDADTLAVRWRVSLGDNSPQGGYYGWCSPLVIAGRVLQGVSSNCDDPYVPGKLVALDAFTGSLLAEADMVPAADPGGGIWSSPALDVASGNVFVTTASAPALDDGHAYSIVRLTFGELSITDSWKVDPGDAFDADWGSSPTLFADAAGRKLVGAGQKDGYYYAFARGDLSAGPLWRVPLAVGGICPQCGNGVLSTAAFDGNRLYAGGGEPLGWTGSGVPGAVTALDPATGATLWRHIFPGPVIAPVSVANGVVFSVGGGTAAALDAETGEELWHFDTDSVLYGGIAISRGRIYFGDLEGRLYAFGVR